MTSRSTGDSECLRTGAFNSELNVRYWWKADIDRSLVASDDPIMEAGPSRRKLPFWAAYLRAMGFASLGLIAADWVRYAATGEWVAWPWVALAAVLWPIIMTAIT